MSVVLGKNVALYAYYGTGWKIIACATNSTLTTTSEVAEKTTANSGIWKEFKAVANSWNVSFEGLTFFDEDFGVAELENLQDSLLSLPLSFQQTDSDSNVKVRRGEAVIETIEQSGQDGSAATFSVSFIGSGALTTTTAPVSTTPGSVHKYDYEAIGGESSFDASVLVNKDVIAVFHDTDHYQVVTTVASSQKACYTAISGTISFDHLLTPGTLITVLYQ